MSDLLITTSKVKRFVRETGGLNTSVKCIEQLSKAVELLCKRGIENAKSDGRKTVLDRDIFLNHL